MLDLCSGGLSIDGADAGEKDEADVFFQVAPQSFSKVCAFHRRRCRHVENKPLTVLTDRVQSC